ncbi:GNAT family N-acetyltransferase [Bifidobacterium pseudolongum]|uniref:GNAT family N-acetyltransferase n=1 Tax=Bifidobacterium pseudolongum TaxID=1694 RepID=UPI001021BBB3|nr:GNAT family N-acetyltransferase [Bifidobacterium pseudolongum]RYQ43436.1 GNAT family acetyltransferase [Bifidobacterium pseudolongum subsp. globosum]
MKYCHYVTLNDGRRCVVRNAEASDAQEVLDVMQRTHVQTDFLRSYPNEIIIDADQERQYLVERLESTREIELVCVVDGVIVGSAGVEEVGTTSKVWHRAELGISVIERYWGNGIGGALVDACIACATAAEYSQLELQVVSDNARALALYTRRGFVEYGRNPRGFLSCVSGYQELVYMRRELDAPAARVGTEVAEG